MKRIALLCLLALGCATTPHARPAHVFKSTGGPTYGTIDLLPTAPGVSDAGMIRIANTAGSLQASVSGSAFAAIGGGQDPSNVSITGGSIVGVNTATRTVQGAESPADKAYQLDVNGWLQTQYATAVGADANITTCREIPLGVGSALPTNAIDATTEGGGLTANANDVILTLASIWQNAPGGNLAVALRVKATSIGTTGNVAEFGLTHGAGSSTRIWFGVAKSVTATNFVYATSSSTIVDSGHAWDANYHDVVIVLDNLAAHTTYYLDTTQAAQVTTAPAAASPLFPFVFSSTTGEAVVSRLAVCYVIPSS